MSAHEQFLAKQNNEDTDRLNLLRVALGLQKAESRHVDVNQYQNILDNTFSQETPRHSEPSLMTHGRLDDEEMFQHWTQTETSCLLHLSGQNWSGASTNSTLLWLSPAATTVIERYRSTMAIVAFYLCQISYHVRKSERSYVQAVARNIIFQLIAQQPGILRSGELSRSLEAALDGDFVHSEEEDLVLERTKDCILEVLRNFGGDERVLIVLDRPDQCYCGSEGITGMETLRCLLQIVLDAPCEVKILLVARSGWLGTRPTDKVKAWLQKEQERRRGPFEGMPYLHRMNWNQESERERSMSPASR